MSETDADGPARLRQLTRDLRRGSDTAWAEFHRDYGPAIFRQLIAIARGDEHLANEALQQTYLRVARYLRPTTSSVEFRAWLRTVARSAILDCRRREHRFSSLLRRRALEPVHEQMDDDDDALVLATLETALAQIPEDERALLEAKYFSGRSVEEIATSLSISPKAAESRLTRARAALRARMQALLHDL